MTATTIRGVGEVCADGPVRPPTETWIAAVHTSEDDFAPLGGAVVLDEGRVLTCAHVVMSGNAAYGELWIAFPKAEGCPRRRVAAAVLMSVPPVRDLAVLTLDEPVPAGVEAARLRCPQPGDLVGRSWWAYGFPGQDPVGNSADGIVGEALTYGWIRLDSRSRYFVEPGFSGAALWSPDYEAVVGIVGQAHSNGDARAITLHQADLDFPNLKLGSLTSWAAEAAGEMALSQWGWTLGRDPEGVRHWRPRARGVSVDSERGWRFRGRTAALTRIASWLDRRTPDRRVLVVTGSPGVGKSAVLGRIVTTADIVFRTSLPQSDEAVRASPGSLGCAVHAKGKTALEIAKEIARAASAAMPTEPDDLAPAIRGALRARGHKRFNVIIDALDEAASPAQARLVIEQIILPLAETCADAGAQVIVGTRRRDDEGDLLGRFDRALTVIDLDDPAYFSEQDLAAYALACLQLAGGERLGNPYADNSLACPLAARIAAMSAQNFLVAGLIARSHGLHDEQATDRGQLTFTATVDSALANYLNRLGQVASLPAANVLTPLAFAEAPGLPVKLWQLAVRALYGTYISVADLARFARSSAANFLIEKTGRPTSDLADGKMAGPSYRLFHQALDDTLLHARADLTPRSRDEDELALTRAFIAYGRQSNWQAAPDYLLRSLADHARAAGVIDILLTDDAYLLRADLRRLMQVADASSTQARGRARLLRLTPTAITASPSQRAAMFSVTETLDNLGATYRADQWQAPYYAQWAAVQPRSELAVLKGHQQAVNGVCAITVDGRDLLASASHDGTVRLWDPQTSEQRAVLQGHQGPVAGVCGITADGRELLASAGYDGTVRLWDPRTGEHRAILIGHQDRVTGVSAILSDGLELLASAGGDSTVRLWDPRTGDQQAVLQGHRSVVEGVCAITVDGFDLLASASDDKRIILWNPQTGGLRAVLKGHQELGQSDMPDYGGRSQAAS